MRFLLPFLFLQLALLVPSVSAQSFYALKDPTAARVVEGRVLPLTATDSAEVSSGRVAGMALVGAGMGGVGLFAGGFLASRYAEERCESLGCGLGMVYLGALVGEVIGASLGVHLAGPRRTPYLITLLTGLGGTAKAGALLAFAGPDDSSALLLLPVVQIGTMIAVSI